MKPFFQRNIVRFETRLDEYGVVIVAAAHLSCGHRVPYKRRRPATTKRSTMPCPDCGAGPRTPWEEARAECDLERVVRRALADPARLRALTTYLRLSVEADATCPLTEDQRRIWAAKETHARTCGLRDRDQAGLHERGPRTLTKAQRNALVSLGRA